MRVAFAQRDHDWRGCTVRLLSIVETLKKIIVENQFPSSYNIEFENWPQACVGCLESSFEDPYTWLRPVLRIPTLVGGQFFLGSLQ